MEMIMSGVRVILHPTDFSENSARAFKVACSLAREHGARLVVLHAAEPPHRPMGMAAPPPLPRGFRGGLEWRLQGILSPDRDIEVDHQLTEGKPVHEIVRVARETDCDLIVMGSQRRRGWKRLFSRSVATNVLRYAPCPVLITKEVPIQDVIAKAGRNRSAVAHATPNAIST
jgi:nucleotide-binding universal stress UspA family protein